MELKTIRTSAGISQKEAAEILNISLRSYKSYENEEQKRDTQKYRFLVSQLQEHTLVDEEHGLLKCEEIIEKIMPILKKYDTEFCYLFGSYAKGTATEKSDVDLLISTPITGLKFYALVEEIRTALNKRVDILDFRQLDNNLELTHEILSEGIKIYG